MRFGFRKLSGCGRVFISVVTLLVAGCSKPEEVISRQLAHANQKLDEGSIDEALETLEKLDRKYPDRAVVLEALGFAYARTSQHEEAAKSFVSAADADPNYASLRQLAAEAYVKQNAYELAAEQHRLYISEFPSDYQSWQKLGEIEERLGDVASAIDAYLEWYRVRPSGEASYRLGAAFRRLNNSPQAKAWFEATIKHGEQRIEEALFGLLELEIEAGDLAAAERTVGQIDKNFPGSLDASDLAGARDRIQAWKQAQDALAAARAEQERLAQELEQVRLKQLEEERREKEQAAAQVPAVKEEPVAETPAPQAPPSTPTQPLDTTPIAEMIQQTRPTSSDLPDDLASAIRRRESGDPDAAADMLWRWLGQDDSRVDLWVELADIYRELRQFSAAEACILEARRRAESSIEVETAYLNIVRASQSRDVYLARVQSARNKFPADANLAYVYAKELAEAEGDAMRTVAAFEDFLLLADPADPRRDEAAAYLARTRR